MRALRISMLALAGLVTAASAQIITTPGISARLDLTWQEDPAYPHNDNGVLEPGERALLRMTLSFSGQTTRVEFAPPIGQYSSGTILGFASAYFDVRSESVEATGLYNGGVTVPASSSVGPNANSSGTSGYGIRGGWRLGGSVANGQPSADGFANTAPGISLTELPLNFPNPISNMERLGWAPASYTQRTVGFSVFPAATAGSRLLGLELDLDGGTTGATTFVPLGSVALGTVNIPIAPSPASLILLGVCGLVPRRRRG